MKFRPIHPDARDAFNNIMKTEDEDLTQLLEDLYEQDDGKASDVDEDDDIDEDDIDEDDDIDDCESTN